MDAEAKYQIKHKGLVLFLTASNDSFKIILEVAAFDKLKRPKLDDFQMVIKKLGEFRVSVNEYNGLAECPKKLPPEKLFEEKPSRDKLSACKTMRDIAESFDQVERELEGGIDPPLDAITHQVQFNVVLNASATPSWTLVHFKGPNPSTGTFASASRNSTHTLNIAMGVPGPALANKLNSISLGAAIGNFFNTSITRSIGP